MKYHVMQYDRICLEKTKFATSLWKIYSRPNEFTDAHIELIRNYYEGILNNCSIVNGKWQKEN